MHHKLNNKECTMPNHHTMKAYRGHKHNLRCARTLDMMHPNLFTEGASDKLSRYQLASDRKQHRLMTELLTAHCTLRRHLCIMGLSEGDMCRKCGRGILLAHTLLMPNPG
jgi:hypothetical protein